MRLGLTILLGFAWLSVWAASVAVVWCVAMFADSPRLNGALGRVSRHVARLVLIAPVVGALMVVRPGWVWLWPLAFGLAAAPAVIVVRAMRRS